MLPLRLDPTSDVPLYRQLREALELAFSTDAYGANELLPSSRELAAELGVSRNTVNAAFQELLAVGYVTSAPRSGYRVAGDIARALNRVPPPRDPRGGSGAADWVRLVDPGLAAASRRPLPHLDKPADWARYPYPFIGGQVDFREFPAKDWLRALRNALDGEHLRASLQDSVTADDPLLLEQICRTVLPMRGISARPEEVLVTAGAQQALHLVMGALVTDGTCVAVEDPGYPDARHIAARAGGRLVGVPVDAQGLDVSQLPDDGDLALVTPSHHYPTNATLSMGRRLALFDWAAQRRAVLLEDDYDSEFRYLGPPTPALKSLDTDGRVVYLSSFSKLLAPGLRMGFLVGDAALVEHLRDLRRYSTRHPPGHLQRALALYLESGSFERHLRRTRRALKTRWHRCSEAVVHHFPDTSVVPSGGMSIWATGPEDVDTRVLAETAQAHGVLFESGDTFFLDPSFPPRHLRLGMAAIHPDSIEPGVALLARLARQVRGVSPST